MIYIMKTCIGIKNTRTLTALDFDVTQLSVHREVLQVHGTRRGYCQATNIETIIIVQRYYYHYYCNIRSILSFTLIGDCTVSGYTTPSFWRIHSVPRIYNNNNSNMWVRVCMCNLTVFPKCTMNFIV